MSRPPFILVAVAAGAVVVQATPKPPSFEKTAVPFVQQHCVECHGPKTQKKQLALHSFRDARSVIAARPTWEKILRKVESGEMPPEEKPRPADAAREAFLAAVRGVFDEADRRAPPDPGRVVARRLNRTEYNNTIRDLFGVDFEPAADFPSDDIGYGFDNIGDVLTLSPTLMERYLIAAEQVAEKAIVSSPQTPQLRRRDSWLLEPRIRYVEGRSYREMSPHKSEASLRGPFTFEPSLNPRESYEMRAKVYTDFNGPPPRVALVASGRHLEKVATPEEAAQIAGDAHALGRFVILKVVDVTARRDEDNQYVEAPIPPGTQRIGIAMLQPPAGQTPTVYVKYVATRGPMDPLPWAQRVLFATMAGRSQAEQTREVMERFLSRAYRRPAGREEVERLSRLVEEAVARGEKWETGLQHAVQAALVTPKFLFRLETLPAERGRGPQPLDDFALASRLSYWLWSSMPDEELFDLARKKQLSRQLEAQVRRMLRDPKAEALVENFALQWLQLRRLETFQLDRGLFPVFDRRLREAMLQETKLFFAEIMRENRSILDLIDADFTYVNEPLAALYGIADTRGNPVGKSVPPEQRGEPIRGREFVRVTLADGTRGGVITQASVLVVTSNPTRTSPVKRGKFVLEQILGLPQPPPVPEAGELPDDTQAVSSASLRERMERHRADPSCATCHARMDPIGFGLENFNAVGAWRDKDGKFPIDASGALPDGTAFNGPKELKRVLAQRKDLLARNLTEKMMIFALGRGLQPSDRRTVDAILAALEKDGYRFATLMVQIAQSDAFRLRRGAD